MDNEKEIQSLAEEKANEAETDVSVEETVADIGINIGEDIRSEDATA